MASLPKTPRGQRAAIDRYRKALQREVRVFGCVDDGGGSRYVLFWLHFLLDDSKASRSYLRWFDKHLPDDAGEPFALLCRTLIHRRLGDEAAARATLADTMFVNLYLIPALLGEAVAPHDMWHSSSFGRPDYCAGLPPAIAAAITAEERGWLRTVHDSLPFRRARQRYIELYRQLQNAPVGARRSAILDDAYEVQRQLRESQ